MPNQVIVEILDESKQTIDSLPQFKGSNSEKYAEVEKITESELSCMLYIEEMMVKKMGENPIINAGQIFQGFCCGSRNNDGIHNSDLNATVRALLLSCYVLRNTYFGKSIHYFKKFMEKLKERDELEEQEDHFADGVRVWGGALFSAVDVTKESLMEKEDIACLHKVFGNKKHFGNIMLRLGSGGPTASRIIYLLYVNTSWMVQNCFLASTDESVDKLSNRLGKKEKVKFRTMLNKLVDIGKRNYE